MDDEQYTENYDNQSDADLDDDDEKSMDDAFGAEYEKGDDEFDPFGDGKDEEDEKKDEE